MIYLTKRDPVKNMARFYALDLQPTLFGGWAVGEGVGPDRRGKGEEPLWREEVTAHASCTNPALPSTRREIQGFRCFGSVQARRRDPYANE